VDALSVGQDELSPGQAGVFKFSVDRDAQGFQVGSPTWPTVFSEGAAGAGEAASDVFVDLGIGVATPAPPVPPATAPVGNVGAFDGDGCPGQNGFFYQGLGLVELTAPADNVDALEMDLIDLCGCGVFWSLSNASAMAQSPYPGIGTLYGGDIIWAYSSPCTGLANTFVRYRTATDLGLDLDGPYSDDLDALALTDNLAPLSCGSPPFPAVPILFSVTPDSSVVGQNDTRYGLPIEPGDILEPPAVAGTRPRIYVPAEILGLRTTRTHGAADNLDGLIVTSLVLCDCNGNSQEDAVDIALGVSLDCNRNGVPDECETPASYCTAGTSASGCQALACSAGTASASAASGFVVWATEVVAAKDGLFFYGQNGRQANPWGNGTSYQCVVPPVNRGGLLGGTGTAGTCEGSFHQDLNARWCPTCPKPSHAPAPGVPLQIQLWYRDPLGTSNQTTSLSDAVEVVPAP
jgi:hypothetical protein